MPLSVTPLVVSVFHVQMVNNGGLPGVSRLLNSVGVLAAPTLVACRALLSWIKSYRDDNPNEPLAIFLAAVHQHFHPLGFWQGFADGMGFHPPNGGIDEIDNNIVPPGGAPPPEHHQYFLLSAPFPVSLISRLIHGKLCKRKKLKHYFSHTL